MMTEFNSWAWPTIRFDQALQAGLYKSGLASRKKIVTPETDTLGFRVEAAARQTALEAEAIDVSHSQLERFIESANCAVLRLPGPDDHFIISLGGKRGQTQVIAPDLHTHWVSTREVCAAVCHEYEAPLIVEIDQMLNQANLPQPQQLRVRTALLRERLGPAHIEAGWSLRLPPGANFGYQMKRAHLWQQLWLFAGAHLAQYLLWLASWWVIGQSALQNRLDTNWLAAWAMLLFALVGFRLLAAWTQSSLSIQASSLLKQRLLYGALRLEPDEIRHQGMGQLLGRVLEAEALETLVLNGGLLGLMAAIELLIATFVLVSGAGGWLQALLLIGWLTFAGLLGWQYFQRRRRWTKTRLSMTHDLIEKMVGHRTRLAQEARERWQADESQALTGYQSLSQEMDQATTHWLTLAARGWLLLGLLGLAPGFISGSASAGAIAVSLGGILLAYQALEKLLPGLLHLAGASIAWKQVAQIFNAAARPEAETLSMAASTDSTEPQPIVEAQNIVFRHQQRGQPVLNGCSLQIFAGERLLLEGPSGGGKSTLMALLTGLRQPTSGQMYFNRTRNAVAAAPQFHENHVLTETFAFNLLMGRRWPPRLEDMQEAEAICGELGLSDLLARMPAGMMQMVGETGWQLSHGERSRLYMARALLQNADMIVLDESFAALDPETLHLALQCALNRARALLVIAHP